MRKKISVIGGRVKIEGELARYADVDDDVRGADVVVLAGDADLERVRRLAPAAALVVVADPLEDRCRDAYERTLFPRARIIGVSDPAKAAAAVESIVFERGDEHEVVALADGQFARRHARLGRGGICELL